MASAVAEGALELMGCLLLAGVANESEEIAAHYFCRAATLSLNGGAS